MNSNVHVESCEGGKLCEWKAAWCKAAWGGKVHGCKAAWVQSCVGASYECAHELGVWCICTHAALHPLSLVPTQLLPTQPSTHTVVFGLI